MALELRTTRGKLTALTVAIAAATAFLGWNFVAKPKLRTVAEIRAQRGGDAAKKDVVQKISDAEKKVAAFKDRLPEKGEASWLIEKLNQLGDASGVSILSVTPVSREVIDGYYRLPVRIEMECGYHQLGDFVSRVENDAHFIKVNAMRVEGTRVKEQSSEVRLHVSMTLSALYPAGELVS